LPIIVEEPRASASGGFWKRSQFPLAYARGSSSYRKKYFYIKMVSMALALKVLLPNIPID
jgi:hypothetical protein